MDQYCENSTGTSWYYYAGGLYFSYTSNTYPADPFMDYCTDHVPTPTTNTTPVANAGTAQSVSTGSVVTLNGSGSSDSNKDALTYKWAFTSKPAGSNAALSSTTAIKPTFTADVAGSYVLSLVVNDGKVGSIAASVTITATIPVPTIQLSSVPDFMEIAMGVQPSIYSMPYSSSLVSNQVIVGTSYTSLISYTLTAKNGNFTIRNLSATDSTGRVVPNFSNLANGQTILAGSPVTFALRSPLTHNYTVSLTYRFTIAETGGTFTFNANLTTN